MLGALLGVHPYLVWTRPLDRRTAGKPGSKPAPSTAAPSAAPKPNASTPKPTGRPETTTHSAAWPKPAPPAKPYGNHSASSSHSPASTPHPPKKCPTPGLTVPSTQPKGPRRKGSRRHLRQPHRTTNARRSRPTNASSPKPGLHEAEFGKAPAKNTKPKQRAHPTPSQQLINASRRDVTYQDSVTDLAVTKYVALQHGWKLDLRCNCLTPQPGFMLLDGY